MGLFGNRKNKETKISGGGAVGVNAVNDNDIIATGADGGELLAVLGAAVSASSSIEYTEESIAVIASAIAAYEADGFDGAQSDLCIRKINRTAKMTPAWGVIGNREQIDSRRW